MFQPGSLSSAGEGRGCLCQYLPQDLPQGQGQSRMEEFSNSARSYWILSRILVRGLWHHTYNIFQGILVNHKQVLTSEMLYFYSSLIPKRKWLWSNLEFQFSSLNLPGKCSMNKNLNVLRTLLSWEFFPKKEATFLNWSVWWIRFISFI